MEKKRVRLNDVALREGAQVAGGAMTPKDQLTYVQYLLEGGIDGIEIGFPASSSEQADQCRRIIRFVREWKGGDQPQLSGLARAVKTDIDAVASVGCDACHIYIPASDSFMSAQFSSDKYGDTKDGKRQWHIDTAVAMVKYAKSLGLYVQYSPEDAARTDMKFLCRIISAVIDAGADRINIPDTTGLRIGSEFGVLLDTLYRQVPNIGQAEISVHCHNDSDHSTHNALQAILVGVDQVEGCFYGIGERSGMTKFEAILMNVSTRQDIFAHIDIRFFRRDCVRIVNFVANALGMPVPRHWTVVGAQNNICSSGSHQEIEAKAAAQQQESAYYSWRPALYGHSTDVDVVVTKSSGRKGLQEKLIRLGYSLNPDQLEAVFNQIKRIAAAKSADVSDKELTVVVQEVLSEIPFFMEVKRCQIIGGEGTMPTATVEMAVNGKVVRIADIGDGPYDAAMKAVKQAASRFYPDLKKAFIVLDHWSVSAVTSGSESLADVYARIAVSNGGNKVFAGRSTDIDTNSASAQAFANCLSWYLHHLNL